MARIVYSDQLWKDVSFLKDGSVPHSYINYVQLTAIDRVNSIRKIVTILVPTKAPRSMSSLATTGKYITTRMLPHRISILVFSKICLLNSSCSSCGTKGALWKHIIPRRRAVRARSRRLQRPERYDARY